MGTNPHLKAKALKRQEKNTQTHQDNTKKKDKNQELKQSTKMARSINNKIQ